MTDRLLEWKERGERERWGNGGGRAVRKGTVREIDS